MVVVISFVLDVLGSTGVGLRGSAEITVAILVNVL